VNTDARTLLAALGSDGYLSVCWKQPGAGFKQVVATLPETLATIDWLGDGACTWYGVNRMAAKPASGRGAAADVTRVTCLYADLDTGKALTPGTIAEARTIIDGLPDPAFIVYSGHGLQPIWPLTGDEFTVTSPDQHAGLAALVKRWGQLIADRADSRGWVTDPVYDLARILRVPGTVNHKVRDRPVPVRLEVTDGVPLTYDEVSQLLAEHESSAPKLRKIHAGKAAQPAVSNHIVREWLDKRAGFQRPATPYGSKTLDGLLAELGTSTAGRHPWMVRSVIRVVELADRGQLDGHQALSIIRDRFTEAINGERPVVGEFAAAVRHSVGQLARDGDPAAQPAEPGEQGEHGGEYGPQVVRLADVEPEHVDWLWDGHLPLGKLVVLDGDPGVGKSTVATDIAARVTTGSPMPDGSAGSKGGVLVLSAEDGLADTIRPRLDAAGADPARVVTITEMTVPGEDGPVSRPVSIPRDLPAIEKVIAANDVRLVIVDVLMAYLGGDVNAHRDQDIRRALHAIGGMAERTGCCVIVLRHLNKSGGPNAMYRGGGSIGIIGAARAGFMCGIDPDDETGGRRVFANIKMNIALEPASLAYYLVTDQLHGVARVQWDGVTERRARDLLAEPASEDDRSERDQAAEWLTGYLTDNGGEASAKDVKKAARADGIAERTLDRARTRAKVTTGRSGFGRGAVYVWRLDLSCTPHARHERQVPGAGEQGEHGGEHEDPGGWPDGSIGAEVTS